LTLPDWEKLPRTWEPTPYTERAEYTEPGIEPAPMKPAAFTSAGTLVEAERWAAREMGVGLVDYQGGGKWGEPLGSDAERLAKLNKVNREWDRLRRQYPNMAKKPVDTLYVTKTDEGRCDMGYTRLQGRKIRLSTADELSAEQLAKWQGWEIRHDGQKYAVEYTRTRTKENFRHELGHALSTDEIVRDWQRTAAKLLTPGNARRDWFRENVSWYAAKIPDEIAETFALMTAPGYRRGMLPSELERVIFKMLGE